MGPGNIREIAAAGADTFVAGSAIFNQPDYKAVIDDMRVNSPATTPDGPGSFDRWVAEGYRRVPVSRTILADTETPLSAYRNWQRARARFCLNRCRVARNGVGTPLSACRLDVFYGGWLSRH